LASVNVNNGGALAPGINGPGIGGIGTLTVNGNLALQSGSFYVVGVNAAAWGKTIVTGTATTSGTSTAEAVFQGTNFQQQYTIRSATGGRTGTFGTFTAVNLPSFITTALVYTTTDVDLTLTSHFTQLSGLTGNQSAVAAGLDNAINSGAGFLTGLAGLTPGQIPAALDALSGEGTTGTQETALGANTLFLNAMTEQGLSWLNSEAGYSVGSGGDRGALSYAANDAKRRQHPALKAIPLKAPVEQPPRWRTWRRVSTVHGSLPARRASAAPTSAITPHLGAQFDTHLVLASGTLWTPFVRASWVHEFEPTRDITATFLTLANSTFTVDGPRAARDAARIDIGSKLAITRNVSLFGTFDGEFSDRSQLYSGNGGVRVVWWRRHVNLWHCGHRVS
jgi:uncharacterized protein with beta-barrel porin domain